MRELFVRAGKITGPYAFLVSGSRIENAVRATHRVFFESASIRTVIEDKTTKGHDLCWAVVFMGCKGSDAPWVLDSVTASDAHIRLSFLSEEGSQNDLYPYFFWVPIGKLPGRKYQLEVVLREKGAICFQQIVQVKR